LTLNPTSTLFLNDTPLYQLHCFKHTPILVITSLEHLLDLSKVRVNKFLSLSRIVSFSHRLCLSLCEYEQVKHSLSFKNLWWFDYMIVVLLLVCILLTHIYNHRYIRVLFGFSNQHWFLLSVQNALKILSIVVFQNKKLQDSNALHMKLDDVWLVLLECTHLLILFMLLFRLALLH